LCEQKIQSIFSNRLWVKYVLTELTGFDGLILHCHISGKASVSLDGDQTQEVSLFECISERNEKAAQKKALSLCL